MDSLKSIPLRWKVAIAVVANSAFISVFAALYFPARQKDTLEHGLLEHTEQVAASVGLAVSVGLKSLDQPVDPTNGVDNLALSIDGPSDPPAGLEDLSAFEEAIDQVRGYQDVRFVALVSDGQTIASFPEGILVTGGLVNADTIVSARFPVRSDAFTGEIVVGASNVRVTSRARRAFFVAILAGSMAILIGVFVSMLISNAILAPLGLLGDRLEELARGDLTHLMAVDRNNELGSIARSYNRAVGGLSALMSEISSSAEALASSSEEMAAVSSQMGANAHETTTQVELVSSSAVEVNTSIQTVAASTDQMHASIREIAHNSQKAASVANEAVTVAQDTNDTVRRLGVSSSEIGDVIKTINSIAEQTNLLALNATIEAARAGEAGKGFAVVANEVKELAKETAKATDDIRQKIEGIQAESESAVAAISAITEKVGEISELQVSMAAAIEQQSVTTAEIGRTIEDSARGSSSITDSIVGVSEAAQSTSAGAADTQNAAQELAQIAVTLEQLLSKFSVSSSGGSTDSKTPPAATEELRLVS